MSSGFDLMAFLPLLIISIVYAALLWPILRRKGKSRLHIIWSIVPIFGMLLFIWVLSLTDKSVLDRLAELEADKGLS
jgi:hypothetical protein